MSILCMKHKQTNKKNTPIGPIKMTTKISLDIRMQIMHIFKNKHNLFQIHREAFVGFKNVPVLMN